MSNTKRFSLPVLGEVNRRTAVKAGALTLGVALLAKAIQPVLEWTTQLSAEEFLQKHYKELKPDERTAVIKRLEEEAASEYGRCVQIKDPQAKPGVKYAYALNLSICIGCRKCAEACHHENNHDRSTNNSYIRVYEMQ